MKSTRNFELARPIAPGEILRDRFLVALNLTQEKFADAMKVSRLSVNQLVNGRRNVTAEMAVRLGRVTSTTPHFWLNLQRDIDLFEAQLKLAHDLPRLRVLRKPKDNEDLITEVDET